MALALVAAAPAAAQTASSDQRTITVTGTGLAVALNDTATVTLGVTTTHSTPTGALADTSLRTRRVLDSLAAQGIAKADIQTQTVSLERSVRPRRKHRKRRVVYTASNSVSVTVRDVSRTGAAIQAAVKAGATTVEGVEFSASNAEALYRQALGAAYDDARAKAAALAQRAGVTLGRPISIQEGQESLPQPGPGFAGSPATAPPVEPGSATITAFVTVVFAIS